MAANPIRVLFLCTGNACRSQMAEAFLRAYGGGRFAVYSAGSIPSGVHPMTVVTMRELGIDASRQTSKHWNLFLNEPPFDYIITVCDNAARNCPVFPGEGKRLHWPIDDPASFVGPPERWADEFRRVRDEIAERVRRFLKSVGDPDETE